MVGNTDKTQIVFVFVTRGSSHRLTSLFAGAGAASAAEEAKGPGGDAGAQWGMKVTSFKNRVSANTTS